MQGKNGDKNFKCKAFFTVLDNCSQVWFRKGLDDSNFLWKNYEALFSLFFKQKNVSNYCKKNKLLFKDT